MYLEIILSDFIYYMPNTVWYKYSFYSDDLIGRIVKIPFGKKQKFGIIINTSNNFPENLDIEKIKEIIEILPYNFSLNKKQLELIFKINKYYFSTLSQVVQLFIPSVIFSPNDSYIKKIIQEENIFLNLKYLIEDSSKKIIELKQKNEKKLKKYENIINKINLELKKYKKLLNFKNLIESENKEIFSYSDNFFKLNKEQKNIFDLIILNKKIFLHGITGSGKTEIYKHAIKKIIEEGNQACFIIPEISLTPQFLKIFESSFDKRIIGVIHSKITQSKKAEIWHSVKSGKIKLIIGSRSAIFMPWQNLGIICIDEVHEWTFKNNSSPNYRTQKIAEFYSELFGTKLLFGTATPDISDYYDFKQNGFKIYELNNRINGKNLPNMEIIDLKKEFILKNYTYISNTLKNEIKNSLLKKEQVILFLNQRGFNSSISCLNCGDSIKCKNCDVSMTFHKKGLNEKLICHYCGMVEKISFCKECGFNNFKQIGVGTQKIFETLQKEFSDYKIKIADSDNIKSKKDYDDLFCDLKNGNIDILIGTQMITKGIDIENISLIGIILADLSMNIPDFKAEERTYQLLVQVAGRAGRGEKDAKILIQTFNSDNEIIDIVKNYDFNKLYLKELKSRKLLFLPPFCEILKISLRNKNLEKLQNRIKDIFNHFKNINKENNFNLIINSAPAIIPKIKNEYIWNIIIRGNSIENFMLMIDKIYLNDCRIDRNPNNLS